MVPISHVIKKESDGFKDLVKVLSIILLNNYDKLLWCYLTYYLCDHSCFMVGKRALKEAEMV